MEKVSGLLVLLLCINFILKCDWEWMCGMQGPLVKMIAKGENFLKTVENENKWQIFRDDGVHNTV